MRESLFLHAKRRAALQELFGPSVSVRQKWCVVFFHSKLPSRVKKTPFSSTFF